MARYGVVNACLNALFGEFFLKRVAVNRTFANDSDDVEVINVTAAAVVLDGYNAFVFQGF